MTYPAIRLKLAVADHFLCHLHSLLDDTRRLAQSERCPPSYAHAIEKACTDAHTLRDQVANIATVFKKHAEEPTK